MQAEALALVQVAQPVAQALQLLPFRKKPLLQAEQAEALALVQVAQPAAQFWQVPPEKNWPTPQPAAVVKVQVTSLSSDTPSVSWIPVVTSTV